MTDIAPFLSDYLQRTTSPDIAAAIGGIATAAGRISLTLRFPDVALDAVAGDINADGDQQKALDVIADDHVLAGLAGTGVASYLSEERETAVPVDEGGGLIVACDPLDGSSNIGVNMSVGTIFSILPVAGGPVQPAENQLAAGFFVYGPQTTLLLTVGSGTASFRMTEAGRFQLISDQVRIPPTTNEFAINSSNARHWQAPVTSYIADCLTGADGPRRRNFNMRWAGSLVADAWRIFDRGGVFLYPADARPGYEAGRLRLVYEAAPMAFLVEQAGGIATTGMDAITDLAPQGLHDRVPLIFGSSEEVETLLGFFRNA